MINCDNIVFEGIKRYYVEDLTERDYSLENTTPYKLEINGNLIEEHSWGELLRTVTLTLLGEQPNYKEQLCSFKTKWSKKVIFTLEPATNTKKLDENLYINCNHTALHSCWLLQDILDYFNVDKNKVKLIIHRPSAAEPKEVKDFIINKFKNEFVYFLELSYGKNQEYANKVLKNIENYLNPRLAKISKAYTSFFLFDDYAIFSNYVKKVKEAISNEFFANEKALKILNICLKYLVDFYKM